MDAFRLLRKMPLLRSCQKSDFYASLENLPLAAKKKACRLYLSENRRLRDDCRYSKRREATCLEKRTFRDYRVERILYTNRRDKCERRQKKADTRSAVARVIKLPKGANVHHVDRNVDDNTNLEILTKKQHIKHHVAERRKMNKLATKRSNQRLLEI